ncbi:DUF6056 family protein [Companilactobacillus nantensis]|nr:DUF6056 family protein [Companilactobacillus nantensis]GEO64689.1 hypothetical protein LNA01_18720 [Companilactobacillus nantensis]
MTRTAKLSFYFIIFIIFGLVGMWMPLLGDDLHWGTYFGSNYFPQGIFLKYDGRYLGDLLVITMTKFKPIAFLGYGTFMTAIVYLIQLIREQIKAPKSIGLVSASLATIFIFLTPNAIFKQILGWHAGFANYVPSLVFPLFMLYLVLKNYDNKNVHYYRTSTYLIFFAAIFAQFFAEHVTILNVFNVVLVWLFFRKHFGDEFKKVLNFIVAGNFIGAFLMFINGAYIKILFGTDSYRSLKGSSNSDTMFNYMRIQFTPKHLILLAVAILIFTAVVIIYSLKVRNTKQKIANFALLLSGFVVVAPFLVVSPFGSRCMFATYMFFVTIFVINFDILIEAYEKYLLPLFLLAAVGLGVKTDAMAHNYGKTFNMQVEYSTYQNNVQRNTQYFLQYKDTKHIWLTAPIESDANFAELYVKNKDRNMVPINYYDWTDALRKIKGKKFNSHDAYMKAFDQQILKKVKLIQAKESK